MLTKVGVDHHLSLGGGRGLAVRVVPLLDGTWLFDSRCSCNEMPPFHGIAATYEQAVEAATTPPGCHPETRMVLVQDSLNAKKRRALLTETGCTRLEVMNPFARIAFPGGGDPAEVTVDGSLRQDGSYGVAAVTRAGWVSLLRETEEPTGYGSDAVEMLAIETGIRMLPLSCSGTVISDSRRAVIRLNQAIHRRHVADYDAARVGDLLGMLSHRDVRITWRPRCSTPAARAADILAKRASAPEFTLDRLPWPVVWRRHGDWHNYQLWPYCDATGQELARERTTV